MYIDLLTKIKNAQAAKLPNVKVPFSKMDLVIAELLQKHNFVDSVEKKGRMPKRILDIKLRYSSDGPGAITGIEFLSKPSRRLYSGYRDLAPVLSGYGLLVVSTPKGIMTGAEAKKEKLGGALLFKIW
jgi:small subunit ribosomal protein S8